MTEKLLTDVEYNYKFIDERIAEAAEKSGRKREDITFLAATKMVEPEVINHAISLGLDHIGENKVQELLSKYDKYNLDNCSLQFIGHLQTNKVRQIIDKVDLIQSVDSIKLASEISKQALKINKNCDVLVEVNIGREENKSGVMPEQLEELLCQIAELDGISVKGLMAIPPICESSQKISEFFNKMHNLPFPFLISPAASSVPAAVLHVLVVVSVPKSGRMLSDRADQVDMERHGYKT